MSIQDAVDRRAATRQATNAQFNDSTLSWTGKNTKNANTGGAAHFATAQAWISKRLGHSSFVTTMVYLS
jgi:hypothetical protein